MKVSVIIPAAGTGKRFGGAQNKIFERIGDKPMFLRTIEAFTGRDDVCQILLAVAPSEKDEMAKRFGGHLGFMGVGLVTGGPTRTESVRNALAVVADEAELVCVHDAARPCLSAVWIDAVFAEAARTGAAILAWPLHGTLKKASSEQVIEQTLDRRDMWEAQTPQVFAKSVLRAAYESGDDATDDAAMVEAIGRPVRLVRGDPRNIKITHPADLALANAVLKTLPKPGPKGADHPFAEDRR